VLGIRIFEAASIAQLIQVELLQHRFAASNLRRRLCQIPKSRIHFDIKKSSEKN
jgi:hypothetical protein